MTLQKSVQDPSQQSFPAATHRLIGVGRAAVAPVLEDWISTHPAPLWIVVCEDEEQAELLALDVRRLHRWVYPESDRLDIAYLPPPPPPDGEAETLYETMADRIEVVGSLLDRASRQPSHPSSRKVSEIPPPLVLVSTLAGLLAPVPAPAFLREHTLTLAAGQPYPLHKLLSLLEAIGYDREAVCEAPGQYAVRGGIIDIYPVNALGPCRVDFFGDEIEEIRELDPTSQRSGELLKRLEIAPSPTSILPHSTFGLAEYLPEQVEWLWVEPLEIRSRWQTTLGNGDPASGGGIHDLGALLHRPGQKDNHTHVSDLDLLTEEESGNSQVLTFEAESLSFYRSAADESKLADERLLEEQNARSRFLAQLLAWQRDGLLIAISLPRQGDRQRLQELLAEEDTLSDLQPVYLEGDGAEGFLLRFRPRLARLHWPLLASHQGLAYVTDTEIFGRRRHQRARFRSRSRVHQSQVDQLLDFSELVQGEFVVHLQHGIALYRGLSQIEMRGETKEVLTLEFDQGVLLHVPLQESHLISRYVGLTKQRPTLGRIGSSRWEKVRHAAERATLDYAARLLELQAKRQSAPGFAYSPDGTWQREFESAFPYKETPDQATAIEATKTDMEKSEPMDRLICGDVGFGKTEVAIRAAFKAALEGKQVAVLVPTTVLAQQHFQTFRERMAGFPIVIEVLSRFRSRRDQSTILKAVREGRVDILIGTHRLIQKDVHFKDLGLVVIDEEQRFGVKHKEVFKEWRETVDLLSMSATPIPRTLYLALTGARQLSVIETPPAERRPIQTFVKSYDDQLIVKVIRQELVRGGQVFYLHNRVQTIESIAQRLRELLPGVRIGVGHGQMEEGTLEQVMVDFVARRFDVLVCTTIIESGLDIPNCNTILIEGADRFGLSQLYQLRGRVGRFRRQAYAYLLLHRKSRVADLAKQRLQALRQHNQLGAGFRIAMRDLELRGSGNLLGAEQSGHIVGVGFELYCQLLRQSIARLRGEAVASRIRAQVRLDFVYQGEGTEHKDRRYEDGYTVLKAEEQAHFACPPVEARIPTSYIGETRLRIDLYRRLALLETLSGWNLLAQEVEDRFGPPPRETLALFQLTRIRLLAEQKGILAVESDGNRLKCQIRRGKDTTYLQVGSRFPRLTRPDALLRLQEIAAFLNNQPNGSPA